MSGSSVVLLMWTFSICG